MNNTKEILDDMRRITMLTGEISSVHEESLKKWPYIVFDSVDSIEIDYNLSKDYTQTQGEGYVDFKIQSDSDQGFIKMRCENLTNWVRDMFWQEIKVIVSLNGTVVYQNSTMDKNNGPKQD